jgi:NADH-quinone oxidoreductase subunit N
MGDFNIQFVMPVIALASFGLLTLLFSPFLRGRSTFMAGLALPGIIVAAAFTIKLWGYWQDYGPLTTAAGMVFVDGFALFFSMLLLVVGALSLLASARFLEREGADHVEFYPLVLIALAGMLVMLQTTHLMVVLIGLEVFSLSLYVLTGLTRNRAASVEGALKYFLLGAFSSGFMIYGMALIYGATGTLDMLRLGDAALRTPPSIFWIGVGLVLIGLAFKIAIVPFHQWVPDVYTGAPTNVTGFMAAATKTAAFAVLLRFLVGALGDQTEVWIPLMTWLAILTMTVANLIALTQHNIKRMLAFSSIAHAGYLLIALVSRPEDGVRAILFYLAAYAFMTVGAFAVLAAVGRGDAESERGNTLQEWAGIGWRRPWLSAAMMVFLLSLAGIPLTGGFLGKYVIFQAAVRSELYVLAAIGAINATIAAYYYLRVIVAMYMREPDEGDEWEPLPVPASLGLVMLVSVGGVLALGIFPGWLLDTLRSLAASIL